MPSTAAATLRRLRQIGRHDLAARSCCLGETLLVDVDGEHISPFAPEAARHGKPDAAGRTGDQGAALSGGAHRGSSARGPGCGLGR